MDEALSIVNLIINASWLVQVVMAILVIMSVYSWTIVLAKKKQILTNNIDIKHFDKKLNLHNNLIAINSSIPKLKHNQTPPEQIFSAGYYEFSHSNNSNINDDYENKQSNAERAYRAMYSVANKKIDKISKDLSILALISNSSPYIGLFGTVWGIMQAFLGLASVKQATIAVVAPGIAEALIATAFGLFAAIPASIFYNRLSDDVDLISRQFSHSIEDLFIRFQR